jgi:regulator of protease activity HflC (stomatin/prohibitin superfamily)
MPQPARPVPQPSRSATPELRVLFVDFALLILGLLFSVVTAASGASPVFGIGGGLAVLLGFFMLFGYFTLQPNEARVLILFGSYRGTVRQSGFFWANPFYARTRGSVSTRPGGGDQRSRSAAPTRVTTGISAALGLQVLSTKLSLRSQTFNSDTLKVNDKRGNPVEIGAVVVWRVENTAQAVFDVEDYLSFVQMQSESALRSIASRYAYDHGEPNEITLRGDADDVALALKEELHLRLVKAGVLVDEARLTHLAYAPEIAPVMLRRQQAEAVISARQIIVQNAVGMVHMALRTLDEQNIVHLDDERKAAMVSNLLVVLCGSADPAPVINTGTLYN